MFNKYMEGAQINSGNRRVFNMACQNPFYQPELLNSLADAPPTSFIQDYEICRNSKMTAVSTGISNAFSSAGLYTAIVVTITMLGIRKWHNSRHPNDRLHSRDDEEVALRQRTAQLLKLMINKMEARNTK
jgi:hypothetical protein